MKIIDLLNKIAKGEEVPKKVKLDEEIYEFNKWGNDYKLIGEEYSHWLFNDYCFGSNGNRLNNEIEILEEVEDKEYEDIEKLSYAGYTSNTHEVDKQLYYIRTINALIRNQKKILERLDK